MTGPYIVCFECGHRWTRLRLRAAYIRGYAQTSLRLHRDRSIGFSNDFEASYLSSIWGLIRCVTWRTSRIAFCPECLHDF